jgi:DeoR family transcriptional regulator, copper-sensing transcriptional repressor
MYLSERQKKIHQLVQERHSVNFQELKELFDISTMTVHRDLDQLEAAGLVQKGRGVATLFETVNDKHHCCVCGGNIAERSKFILNLKSGEQLLACCLHCGLVLLRTRGEAEGAMVPDFIYGTMVNLEDCTLVSGSSVELCCSPTVLCFGLRANAERFILGFGGQIRSLESLLQSS